MNRFVLALALGASQLVYAQGNPEAAAQAQEVVSKAFAAPLTIARPPETATPVAKMAGWALGIAAIAALAGLTLKKNQRTRANGPGAARVEQTIAIGAKRALLVVSFGGKQLLLGSTEAGLTALAAEPLPEGGVKVPTEFSNALDSQLNRWLAEVPVVNEPTDAAQQPGRAS